jgi:putative ABC transport system permease protein
MAMMGASSKGKQQGTHLQGTAITLGAGTGDIMRLLIWQFTKPVLWANLIAWP